MKRLMLALAAIALFLTTAALPSVADGGLLAAGPSVIDVIWQSWQKGSSIGEG